MSLASEIAASIQRITLDVRVGGGDVSEVTEASVELGFDQANAQATLYTRARPAWAEEGQAVEIWAGYNGQTARIFRGELNGLSWEDGPGRVALDCRDLLARTRLAWQGDDVEESNIDSAALVRHILEIYGIPSSAAHIEGSGWTLGTIQPVTLKKGEIGFSLIERIDALEGYKTFTDSAGVIRRMRVSGAPAAGAALSIGPSQLLERPRRVRSRDGIQNACVVTGISIAGITVGGPGVAEVRAPNPYIPDPPRYVGPPIQDDLIEDDETAIAIAARTVADKNRRPEGLELPIVGDPRVQPGMTLAVTEEALETGGAVNTFVEHVSHRIGSTFTTTIRTTGGNLSGYVYGIPPIAQFDLQLFLEAEDTGSGVIGLIVGVADGSQSYDPDGTTLAYAWALSATGATPDPATASGPICRFTLPASATGLTIALTVTDADGLTNTLSRTIPIDTTTTLVEDLYTAEGSVIACSSDGEQTWKEAAPPGQAMCLAPFGPAWGQCWGTDSGHVVATFDKLLTLVDLGQPHGAVACTAVWVHEIDPTRLWAGFADGAVWFAVVDVAARTADWRPAGTCPAGPIHELRETLAAFGSLRATAGAGYYASENAGASWALLHTFDTAWRMAAGFDLNLASGLNDAAPLSAEEDAAPTVPGGVTHVRALTFGWRTKALYAADDAANLYATDATLASLTDTADDAPAGVNHMIRSGNLDGIVYLACGDGTGDNGAAKWIPGTKAPFFIRRSGSRPTYMVGYGPAHARDVVAQLLIPTTHNVTPGGVYHYVPGVGWTLKNGGLPSGWNWNIVVANPFDAREWLMYGNTTSAPSVDQMIVSGSVVYAAGTTTSPLWHTTDAGLTWSPVTLGGLPGGVTGLSISGVVWNEFDRGAWFLSTAQQIPYGGWRGRHGATIAGPFSFVGRGLTALESGTLDDFVAGSYSPDQQLNWISASNVLTTLAGGTASEFAGVARLPGTRMVAVMRANGALDVSGDYQTVVPVQQLAPGSISGGTFQIAGATHGLYAVGVGSSGIAKISDPAGSPAVAIVAASGQPMGNVVVDRQRRSLVGALSGSRTTVYLSGDGATWTTVATPAGVELSQILEVMQG